MSKNSSESSNSQLPAGLNAPQYGMMIKLDRAVVSKGYGFVTCETYKDAQRAQASGNIILRERRLNIAPAIRKQPFSRVYDPTHQYSYISGYPVVYPLSVYFQQQALKYRNAWNAPSGGQCRGAPLSTSHPATAHPAYLYLTTLVSLGSGVRPASNEIQEYHDPAIVETGSEVGAAMMPSTPTRRQDESYGTPSSLLASAPTSVLLDTFMAKLCHNFFCLTESQSCHRSDLTLASLEI
ncbi:hypothetical protein MRX96_057858 [Rhipicephalus microplus]